MLNSYDDDDDDHSLPSNSEVKEMSGAIPPLLNTSSWHGA